MAQRFGGKYSPDGSTPEPTERGTFQGARRTRAGGRVNLLFLAPLPLAVRAFVSSPIEMAQYLIALGALILAAWLTREGIIAQEAYDARKVARRPKFPRKIAASILTGLGLALAGAVSHSGVEAVVFAALGAGLHFFAFGADPLTDKGMEGVDQFQTDRVARAVDEAEKYLAAMSDAVLRAGDRAVVTRLERFQASVRELLRTVENDPPDLTGARKYLSVYLMGARDATIKFADLYAQNRDTKGRTDYLALLDDLETTFAERSKSLLADNRTDLAVEIEVLRDRLSLES